MEEEKTHEESWNAFLEAYALLKEDNERLKDILDAKFEQSSSDSKSRDESGAGS